MATLILILGGVLRDFLRVTILLTSRFLTTAKGLRIHNAQACLTSRQSSRSFRGFLTGSDA